MHIVSQITLLMVLSFFSIYHANDNPLFIKKYTQNLPAINDKQDKLTLPEEKAHIIADYLYRFMPQKAIQELHSLEGTVELESKLTNLISEKKRISLLLLGFPFKSRNNEKKCISSDSDMGEYLALITLHQLVKNIKLVYCDAHCTIISDGFAYHLDNYDAPIDQIEKYHAQMIALTNTFPTLSFVSWKINDSINSYQELQEHVAAVPLNNPNHEDKTRYNEMKAFALSEFSCTFWETSFMEKAKTIYEKQQLNDMHKKLKDQKIRTIKNSLISKKIESIVPELINKGKQFSTFVSVSLPCYQEYIRLSVHCDKHVNVYEKIPVQLIHNNQGTPWHNALVINESSDELKGFAKDIFKSKLNLITQTKNALPIKAEQNILLLSYATYQGGPL